MNFSASKLFLKIKKIKTDEFGYHYIFMSNYQKFILRFSLKYI